MEVDNRDLEYLSSKRTHLASPGIKLDSNYYSVMNSTVAAVETTYNTGRLTVSLTNSSFGSQAQVIIPNSSFLGNTYLHLELPNLPDTSILPIPVGNPNSGWLTLSRGWGYSAIQSISYLFGSSNVSQLTLQGNSMWQQIAMQCETAEKRSEFFRLGGEEVLVPLSRLDTDPLSITYGEQIYDKSATLSADLLLPLPWSSAAGLYSKLPFDTNMLNSPITVQIQFNQPFSIYGGSGVPPLGFGQARMIFRQGNLQNKDQSLRRIMDQKPELSMMYPFIHTQSYQPTQFYGSADISNPISIPLLGFINADLLSITVGIVRTSLLTPAGNGSPCTMLYDNLKNVQLIFNGLVMYNAPGSSWKLYNMNSDIGASYFHNSLIKPHSGSGPFDSSPVDSYILTIDFSRIRSLMFEGHFQNVWRIANNVLTLQFNTEGNGDVKYQLFATYAYNGIAQIQHGQTSIYFD